jgi:hypothetical protein
MTFAVKVATNRIQDVCVHNDEGHENQCTERTVEYLVEIL